MRRQATGIVVLTHGRSLLSVPLVESLLGAGLKAPDIVVVHNPVDPDDPAPRMPDPGVKVLRMDGNRGYAGGMNSGIRHHLARRVERILLLTHDVRFHAGSVQGLLAAAGRLPAYGVLGPVVMWEGRPFSYGGLHDRWGRVWLRTEPPAPAPGGGVLDTDWVEGSTLLISARAYEDTGPFEERFFGYFEESDFCRRAAQRGWKVGVVLDAVAEQEPAFDRRPGAYSYLMARNGLEFARRVGGAGGVALALGRQVRESWHFLRVWKGRRSKPDQRRRARSRLFGSWTGTGAFFIRRWGPPPALIQEQELRTA